MSDPASPTTDVAAFFDLDKTLLTVNSGRLWLKREYRVGRIGLGQVVQGATYLLLYHLGIIDMDRAMGEAAKTVGGLPEEEVRRWTEEWFLGEVKQHAAPGAWSVLEEHREQGHRLVLLTSSSPYASACAVKLFDLDEALSTRFVVADGHFTGRFEKPLCYGPGKVHHATRYARERGIDLDRSWFYTDSLTDLPMLEAVGHPVVVHPDPRLRRLARRRGWPIRDWRTPVKQEVSDD